MKQIILLLLASAVFGFNSMAQPVSQDLPSDSFKWKVTHKGKMQYLEYLPKNYKTEKQKRWPLMLFLHGAGERGNDVQLVAKHGPLKLVREGHDFPFIIIAPQCPTGQWWKTEPLIELIANAQKKFRVDPDRIYVAGLSMGGFGTWKLGINYPEKFAGIIPICGGGDTGDIVMSMIDHPDALKRLPIWAFHGAKDPVVPVDASKETVAFLKSKGVEDVKLTIYPDAQHDSWTQTFDNPEIYDWLLQHKRSSAASGGK
ncbi:MAG TPA: prolyl oligopeptidase family serine peptidase [Verrucomicrobiae bacterium]